MGKEKRNFLRYRKTWDFSINIGGKDYNARTLDYSLNGVSIMLEGFPTVNRGDLLNLNIGRLGIKTGGKVVRVSRLDDGLKIGVQRMGLMHGNIKDFHLSDIMLGLQRSSMTGMFYFMHSGIQKCVYFKDGDMIFATSNQEEDWLGSILVRERVITPEQFRHTSEIMKQTGKRHGTVLVEQGYIKPTELFVAVKKSVEGIILSLFGYTDGDFMFKEGPLKSEEIITLKLSAANLIYRGVKNINDEGRLRDICPVCDQPIGISADPLDLFQSITFDEDDKKILSVITGTSTLDHILERTGLDLISALKSISALFHTRIIENKDFGVSDEEEVQAEDVLGAASGSASQSGGDNEADIRSMLEICETRTFYDILGIGRGAQPAEIKRSYYAMARKYHPDKHFALSGNTKEKLNKIFTFITTAYSTLSNPVSRAEYDRNPTIHRKKEVDPAERAAQKFKEGRKALDSCGFDDAARLFSEAAYLEASEHKYHYFTALAFARLERHRDAERAIQRAIRLEAFNADYLALAGDVFLALGYPLRAKSYYEKALKVKPLHEHSLKGLAALPKE